MVEARQDNGDQDPQEPTARNYVSAVDDRIAARYSHSEGVDWNRRVIIVRNRRPDFSVGRVPDIESESCPNKRRTRLLVHVLHRCLAKIQLASWAGREARRLHIGRAEGVVGP